MEHWEFLLQKEGDRSWLPLDSPDVEILEGRYRIVARSSHTNTAIDIRIAHLATEADPPKRRVQKRACRTNASGLMVVIPFTHLEPGLWELCCSPTDLLSDLMSGAHPHAVKLQVVARESEEEWDPDWTSPAHTNTEGAFADIAALPSVADRAYKLDHPEAQPAQPPLEDATPQDSVTAHPSLDTEAPLLLLADAEPQSAAAPSDRRVDLPPEVATILGASMDRLFQIAEQMSERLVDEVLQDFDLTAIADAPEDAAHAVASTTADRPSAEVAPASTHPVATQNTEVSGTVTLSSGCALATGEAFALTLEQTAFVAARHEVLTVSGQVTIVPATSTQSTPSAPPAAVATAPTEKVPTEKDLPDLWDNDAKLNLSGASAQELQLCLRDPQSLQVLVSDRQPLSQGSFPRAFTFSFSLPDTFATHLVLGEVLLCGTLAGKPEAPIALTTQAFSITVDPNALVGELTKLHEALATDIADEERIDLPLELSSRLKEPATPPLNLSFLDLAVAEPPDERSPRFPSLAGQPLPPQLYHPDPNQERPKTLDLPAFKLLSAPESTAPTKPDTTAKAPGAEAPGAEAPELEAIATNTLNVPNADHADGAHPLPTERQLEVPPSDDALPDDALPDDALSKPLAEAIASEAIASEAIAPVSPDRANGDSTESPSLDLPSPTHMAFQSLKLQDRFLTRLTSLATDTELSALLKADIAPGFPLTDPMATPSAADVRSLTDEIVVDDDPSPPHDRRRSSQPLPHAIAPPSGTFSPNTFSPKELPLKELPPNVEPPNPLVLPADEPVPMPTLNVVTGELTSGKSINVRVKLPSLLPRIYVKLWVTDRQTRSLLDGPRWLVDFLPNGLGDLEALTPLTVPFGSVEIRFEAIAVEMHTQRESHKVTLDRVVVPPDLPLVSLDDFNT